jgi:hypothetical protein
VTRSQFFEALKCESKTENNEKVKNQAAPWLVALKGVEEHARAPNETTKN